ncbi:hypothetical protein B0H13DRAFT_1919069 [Mycena leptocephala]|nr:hypothetical protein B0H13DRAFT_1919069 [Mycena leptocephala]
MPLPAPLTTCSLVMSVLPRSASSSLLAHRSDLCGGSSQTILVMPVEQDAGFNISQMLLEEYVRDAGKSDEGEHKYFSQQLESQLIFAGIFSAVVVQLIPQTYPLLQVENPSISAVAINLGLFGSLITSLCTAIMSLQCRAWLDGYQPYRLGACDTDSQEALIQACRIRQYRHDGLVKYNVLYAARTAGPTLIYVSFILFFIALVVFLLELHVPTAIAIVTFLGIFLVGHGLTSVIPCLTTEAPYRTPLSSSLEALYRGARTGQMPSQRLNELAELADIEQHRTRIDKKILTWLATSAKRTVIQEKAAELLFQANKNELVM